MELKELLQSQNFEFKKKFGQNFIADTNLLQAICTDAELEVTDEVLEIGVGAGTLTRVISKNAKKVVGYEIDKTLKSVHEISLQGIDNAIVVFNDFMKADPEEINQNFSKSFKVVANLPYYITTNIIFKLLDEKFNIKSLTLMVQKEVAERLVAKSGTKDYGSITVELDSIGDVSIKRIVDRKMFNPAPNVDSAIVHFKINRNKYNIADWSLLQKVIRAGFSMRRKTLTNCLKTNFGFTSEQLDILFNNLGLEKTIRGEALTTKQFVELSNEILKLKNI